MTYTPTGLTYELRTYDDMMSLTTEQFHRMLEDFKAWRATHDLCVASMEAVSVMLNKPIEEIKEETVLPDHFVWIDDGIEGGNCKLVIGEKP